MTILSSPALAGSYANANRVAQSCDVMGQSAAVEFGTWELGIAPPEREKDRTKLDRVRTAISAEIKDGMGSINRTDAYMIGWSHCMDYMSKK